MITDLDLAGKEVEMGVEREGVNEYPCVMDKCTQKTRKISLWYLMGNAAWITLCDTHRPRFTDTSYIEDEEEE